MQRKIFSMILCTVLVFLSIGQLTVFAAAGDLTVSEVRISNPYFAVGDVVSFTVVTKNIGNATATGGWLGMGLHVNGQGMGYKGANQTLEPGGTYEVTFTGYEVTTKELQIVATTDTSMTFVESNESNNTLEFTLKPLREGVDLALNSVKMKQDSFQPGDAVNFVLGISNAGALDMKHSVVKTALSINGQQYEVSELIRLPSGASYEMVSQPIQITDNSIEVEAILNFDNSIEETMDTNNMLKTVFTHVDCEAYQWDTVRLGGGGYVVGAAVHPSEPNLMYIRTDVGGAYRWDAEKKEWLPLTDWISRENGNLYGIQGIAIDEKTPDNLYLCAGAYSNRKLSAWSRSPEPCDVLKSTDRGKTWKRTNLNADFEGNGANRSAGEPIAVDPNNSDILYVGTPYDGLFRCTNATAKSMKWDKVELPGFQPNQDYNSPEGIRTVLFDRSSVKGGVSQTIYVGVLKHGVYVTHDAGKTWSLIPGSPTDPGRMSLTETGVLYCTAGNGVFKYEQGAWMDISPEKGMKFLGISTQPGNPNAIVCARNMSGFKNSIYLSENGGVSWRQLNQNAKAKSNVAWWGPEKFGASIAWTLFDPSSPTRVWFGDWYGIWVCEDIFADETVWTTYEDGHEEMVAFDMATPSQGARLYTVMADNDGARHEDIFRFPQQQLDNPEMNDGNGIDFCEEDPNIVVRVGGYHWGESGDGGYTLDGGVTWHAFDTYPTDEKGVKLPNGRVTVSSKKNANGVPTVVVTPINTRPYRSDDMGKTWTEITTLPEKGVSTYWSTNIPADADRTDGNYFYYYSKADGGFYVSRDNGKKFAKTVTLPKNDMQFVRSAPGIAGEVWVSLDKGGLYRSGNYGQSFVKLENVQQSYLMGFGKEAPGKNVPTAYVYGRVNNTDGIFRSTDLGQTWVRINDSKNMLGCQPKCMKGDRQTFGIVYIGSGGRGFYYGAPMDLDISAPRILADALPEKTRAQNIVLTGRTDESAVLTIDVNGKKQTAEVLDSLAFSVPLSLEVGENIISLQAADKSGNISEQILSTVEYDPGYIEIVLDQQGGVSQEDSYGISGCINVVNASATVDISGVPTAVLPDGTFSTVLSISEGENTITVTATDDAGHCATRTITVLRDHTPPVITLDTADGEVADNMLVLCGSTNEPCIVGVGDAVVTTSEIDGYRFAIPLALNCGKNILNVTAMDLAGNTTAKQIVLKYTDFILGADDVMEGHHIIVEKAGAVHVDGVLDEPEWKVTKMISKTASGVSDNVAKFGLMADDEYLYIGVRVYDSVLVKNESDKVYQDDSVEFYIDCANNKKNSYDTNDNQIFISLDGEITDTKGYIQNYECKVNTDENGYVLEARIAWADLKVPAAPGVMFGFDIAINDDDTGGDRSGVLTWSGDADNWKSKAHYGTAYLYRIQ